jgi:hypothetical protein
MANRLFKGAEYLVTQAAPGDVFTPEDLTEEQRQIADTATSFVRDEVLPVHERLEHQEPGLARSLMRKAGDAGSASRHPGSLFRTFAHVDARWTRREASRPSARAPRSARRRACGRLACAATSTYALPTSPTVCASEPAPRSFP